MGHSTIDPLDVGQGSTYRQSIRSLLSDSLENVGLQMARVERTEILEPGWMKWTVLLNTGADLAVADVAERVWNAFCADVTPIEIIRQGTVHSVGLVVDVQAALTPTPED